MGLIAIFFLIISLNWIFSRLFVRFPLYILDLIGHAFWVVVGVVLVSFIISCFQD
jgi:hypothetical protein